MSKRTEDPAGGSGAAFPSRGCPHSPCYKGLLLPRMTGRQANPGRRSQLPQFWLPLAKPCPSGVCPPRSHPRTPATHVRAPLKVGEVHVGNEEDGLGVEVDRRLEDRDVHALVRGKQ